MSTDASADRMEQIERDLAERQERLQFHRNNLEKFRKDEDMIDAATRESGRINQLNDEIAQLEAELRALKNQGQ